jgi:Rha family phage regulatory protein
MVFNFHDAEVVDSREVAAMIGKRHDHLVRDIDGYMSILSNNPNLGASNFFIPSTYNQAGNGKENPCYLLTKKAATWISSKIWGLMFFETEIPDSYGRPQRAYLNERVLRLDW